MYPMIRYFGGRGIPFKKVLNFFQDHVSSVSDKVESRMLDAWP